VRRGLLVAIVAAAAAASAGEAPFRLGLTAMLLGANDEVGGVDEVDTYPSGLPQVAPEVVSPPLRPGQPPALPVQPLPGYGPPGYLPPGYQPFVPVRPPRRGRGWRYRTVLSAGRKWQDLYGTHAERERYDIDLLFKKVDWDGKMPFDHFDEWSGAGYISVSGTPPDSGWFDNSFYRGGQDGLRAELKLFLAKGLFVEGHVTGLFTSNYWFDWPFYEYNDIEETLFGLKGGLLLGDGLALWYGQTRYQVGVYSPSTGWLDWGYVWNTYGADWLFPLGKQHFKVGFCRSDTPAQAFWFEGPFEETRLEFSWFPYKQLKLAFGFKRCPDSNDDSTFFVAKWDLASWLGLGAYYESSEGASQLKIASFSAALRF